MRSFLTTLFLIISTSSYAQLPEVGQTLPAVTINGLGSMELEGDEMVYQPWSTSMLAGKLVYLQHMAARSGIDGLNKHLDEAVEAEGYSREQLLSVAIANKDDAVWGTGLFVAGELRKNKRRYPETTIVVDDNGTALQQWQLEKKNAAVIILSPQGKVLFFKQAALSAAEVNEVLDILSGQVERQVPPGLTAD